MLEIIGTTGLSKYNYSSVHMYIIPHTHVSALL